MAGYTSQWHYLYAAFLFHATSFFYIDNHFLFTLVCSSPPSPPPLHPEAYAVYFLCLSIRVPWFLWDWILSKILPEGGLSCIDPLSSTALCRGNEVWEMWCIWPGGCTSTVFSDDLTCACGPKLHYSYIHSYEHTSISVRAISLGSFPNSLYYGIVKWLASVSE